MSVTRVVILCAGQGTRLRPLTDNLPKCMVPINGRPLIEWQIDAIKQAGINDIVLVGGYCAGSLKRLGWPVILNKDYDTTNMVYSLWCARKYFGEGFVMAYGDIVYRPQVLTSLLEADAGVSIVVDRAWRSYWESRTHDVLSDAESLKIGADGSISSIGQKASSIDEIEGQYIGLVKFDGAGCGLLKMACATLHAVEPEYTCLHYGNKTFGRMYMTDLLQGLALSGHRLDPVWIEGGWAEVDTFNDIAIACRRIHEATM